MKQRNLIILIVALAVVLAACLTVCLLLSAANKGAGKKDVTDTPAVTGQTNETQEQIGETAEKKIESAPTGIHEEETTDTAQVHTEKEDPVIQQTQPVKETEAEKETSAKETPPPATEEKEEPPLGENSMGWA